MWTISEHAIFNIALWWGIGCFGVCVILLAIEKVFMKEAKISGRTYAGVIVFSLIACAISMVWGGREVTPGKTKDYTIETSTETTSRERIRIVNKQLEEQQEQEYQEYSQDKADELRKESDSFFEELMEAETKQREQEKKDS